MTSLEMLREFRVGIDKIDSQSYPEIYDEQIFMFINRFITQLVNAGRKVFEEDQTITDNLKSLIPSPAVINGVVDSQDSTRVIFDLQGLQYFFYISSYAKTSRGELQGKAQTKATQHDDIEVVLQDPFNNPRIYKFPITFARNKIVGYTDGSFVIDSLILTYVKKPAIVSATVNCDLDEQTHYSIVEGAIELAAEALGIRPQELNKQ